MSSTLSSRPATPSSPPRQFCRIEDKYLVHRVQAANLLDRIRDRIVPDPSAGETGLYRVTSLYYDTPKLDIFRSKLDRSMRRQPLKLRMRIYGDEFSPDVPAMVEVKGKDDAGLVRKNRIGLPLSEAYALCSGRLPENVEDAQEIALALRVEFLVRRMRLKPVCVVSYTRQAFQARGGSDDLRITFDGDLDCREPDLRSTDNSRTHRFIPDDYVVLEVKYRNRTPNWLDAALQDQACARRRMSKYVSSMVALGAGHPANQGHTPRLRAAR